MTRTLLLLATCLSWLALSAGCSRNPSSSGGSSPEGAPPPSPAPAPSPVVEFPDPAFHWGINIHSDAPATAAAQDLGCTDVRVDLSWGTVEPTVVTPTLTRAAVTEAMIDAYAFSDPTKNWSETDALMQSCAQRGLRPVVILGNGFTSDLPIYITASGQPDFFTPDAGTENYLGHLYLFASAAAKRYGNQVRLWQLENELNLAGYAVLWGWRIGLAWWDWSFLTDVMTTLKDAVKNHDSTSSVAVNFHTVMPEWPIHVALWQSQLDVIGIDAYPNYTLGWPVLGDLVGADVGLARLLAPGKKVIVFETGYPTQPAVQGFGEQAQVDFMNQAVASVKANGGEGFFWFTYKTTETPTTGGVGFPFAVLGQVEGYWGLVRADGTAKPAYAAYKAIPK